MTRTPGFPPPPHGSRSRPAVGPPELGPGQRPAPPPDTPPVPVSAAYDAPPVRGVADRRGREDVRVTDSHMVDEQPEPAKRGERLFPRALGEAAGLVEAFAEPRQHFFVEDRDGDAFRAGIDDQSNGVRPDVDDGYGFGSRHSSTLSSAVKTQLGNSPALL